MTILLLTSRNCELVDRLVDTPDTIKDVVVVVHEEEIDLFKLQLRTFDTFLESCNLHYIINETSTKKFKKAVQKDVVRITQHKIRFWSRGEILKCHPDIPGWSSQQLLKLLIPLPRDWIVFDCKDLLIRPVQLIDLDKIQRKDYIDLSLNDPQGEFYQGLCDLTAQGKIIGSVDATKINMNQTPRVIDNRVIRKINEIFKTDQEFIDWFCTFKVQGEFILHDYIAQSLELAPKLRFPVGFIAGIWRQHNFDEFTFDMIPATTCVYKCHRRVYNIEENRKIVDAWISKVIKTYTRYQNAINGR